MHGDIWMTLLGLGAASYAIRLGGVLLAGRLPQTGRWARGMEALPGCLIISLVALMMLEGGKVEWGAGGVVFLCALVTRNLALSLLVGMAVVALLRFLVP